MKLHQEVADELQRLIEGGVFRPGDKVPSVRRTRRLRQVSQSTVLHAYSLLETRGVIESRPRSGYYVRQGFPTRPDASASAAPPGSEQLDEVAFDLLRVDLRPLGALGAQYPDPVCLPRQELSKVGSSVCRRLANEPAVASLPPGLAALRRQIARRYLQIGVPVAPEEIVITAGGTEAQNLCVEALTRPGDCVAVSTLNQHSRLRIAKRRGLDLIPIRDDARAGLDLAHLHDLLSGRKLRAVWLSANCGDPTGRSFPDSTRAELARLVARCGVPLIEDDFFRELHFSAEAPRPIKAWDSSGRILHCGTFSAFPAPGLRVGWIAAGRHASRITELQTLNTLGPAHQSQQILAEFLARGALDAHVRSLRRHLLSARDHMLELLRSHFPPGSRAVPPDGGYFAWVSLDPAIDTFELYQRARNMGILFAPGALFSASGTASHCMRLNYSAGASTALDTAVAALGDLVHQMQRAAPRRRKR